MEAGAVKPQKDSAQSPVDTTLSARQFYQHDPLLVLLKEKLHLNNFWISAGTMLLPGIVYLLWIVNSWHLITDPKQDFSNDFFSIIIQVFIVFPLLFLIYAFIPNAIAKIFNTLYTDGVIGDYRKDNSSRTTYACFKQQLVDWIDNSWWTVAIMVVVILYILLRLFTRELPDPKNLIPFAVRAIVIIIYAPLMFATGMNVIRLVLALVFINRLFYLFTLQITPLHSDGSGELSNLESLLWLCVSMMLWVAILLVAAVLAHKLSGLSLDEMFLLGAIYVALIPALLIGWLIFPHRMMVKARYEALQPLAIEYRHALMQSLSSGTQDTQSVAAETLRLETLKKRYDLLYSSFAVWPLETSTLSRVGVTVIIPVILPLILPLIFPSIIALISLMLQRFGL